MSDCVSNYEKRLAEIPLSAARIFNVCGCTREGGKACNICSSLCDACGHIFGNHFWLEDHELENKARGRQFQLCLKYDHAAFNLIWLQETDPCDETFMRDISS